MRVRGRVGSEVVGDREAQEGGARRSKTEGGVGGGRWGGVAGVEGPGGYFQ